MDWQTVWVVLIMSFASLTRSAVGFGEALIAMPLLTLLLDPKDAGAFVALVAMMVSLMILRQDWRNVRFQGMLGLVLASWAGIPIGICILRMAPKSVVLLLLAGVILSFCFHRILWPATLRLPTDRWAWLFGLSAGVLGGAYNTQGPPIVIYGTLRHWTPQQFRATIQAFAICTVPVIVASHVVTGSVTPFVFTMFLVSLPFAWLAVLCGHWVNRRLGAERFVHVVHVLLFAIALSLIYFATHPNVN